MVLMRHKIGCVFGPILHHGKALKGLRTIHLARPTSYNFQFMAAIGILSIKALPTVEIRVAPD